jgi:acyl carrier protein
MSTIRDQVSEVLYTAIAATMGRPAEELSDSTELIADLGVKSVNFVRIIAALEDEFELEIPFMEFRRKKSIGAAIDYTVQLYES